jgi:hypothetical protein
MTASQPGRASTFHFPLTSPLTRHYAREFRLEDGIKKKQPSFEHIP